MKKDCVAITHPQLQREWSPKNTISPYEITAGSHRRIEWIGSCGHTWMASLNKRTQRKDGCPYCSGHGVLVGFNDLESKYPEVSKEWDYQKNKITPQEVTAASHKKVWWICAKGHEYEAPISARTCEKATGCPYCSNKKVLKGYNDLETTHPYIAKLWDYKKNKNILLSSIQFGTAVKYWFTYPNCNHSRYCIPRNMDKHENGTIGKCPVCANLMFLEGFNDLETVNPNLALEFDAEKNNTLPNKVLAGGKTKYYWRCPKGHSYYTSIECRIKQHTGCPICAKTQKTSIPEKIIFHYIKENFSDTVENYRPEWLNGMEFDMFIPSLQLAIEYDGVYWHSKKIVQNKDIKKIKLAYMYGVFLVKIREIGLDNLDGCKCFFAPTDYRREIEFMQMISELFAFIKEKYKILLKKPDNYKMISNNIASKQSSVILDNNLSSTHPSIAKEWDYELNKNVTPEMVTYGSDKKYHWICSRGHKWEAVVANRTRLGRGCPYCSHQKILPETSLARISPEIAKEWDYEKNEISPYDVFPSTSKKYWWLCKKHGSYLASPNNRQKGKGCPKCGKEHIKILYNKVKK